jgi:hypothetical protein
MSEEEKIAAEAAKVAAEKLAAEAVEAAKVAAEKAAAEKAAKEKEELEGKTTPSDKEAALLKEVMEKKAKLKEIEDKLKLFEDIDPSEAKKLLAEKKEAEKSALEAKGEFDRVKAMMAEEHTKEVTKVKTEVAEKDKTISELQSRINDLTIGTSFSDSKFVKELVSPSKARIIYGNHFSVEDGVVVAYDKPIGSANRTKLVDSSGNSLNFEAAITKIVESDPDADTVIRSRLKEGGKSKTTDASKTDKNQEDSKGVNRIGAALAALNKK